MPLQDARESEDIADIVIDNQDSLTGQYSVSLMELFEQMPLRLRQIGLNPVQEECGLIKQPIHRFDALDNYGVGYSSQFGLLLWRKLPARVYDDRKLGEADLVLDLLDELEARHIGQS